MRITYKALTILILISSIFSQGEKEIIIEEEKKIVDKRKPVRFSKEMKGTGNGKRMRYLASHYATFLYE